MLRYATPRYATPRHATPRHATLRSTRRLLLLPAWKLKPKRLTERQLKTTSTLLLYYYTIPAWKLKPKRLTERQLSVAMRTASSPGCEQRRCKYKTNREV
jgi:hypothetical protein